MTLSNPDGAFLFFRKAINDEDPCSFFINRNLCECCYSLIRKYHHMKAKDLLTSLCSLGYNNVNDQLSISLIEDFFDAYSTGTINPSSVFLLFSDFSFFQEEKESATKLYDCIHSIGDEFNTIFVKEFLINDSIFTNLKIESIGDLKKLPVKVIGILFHGEYDTYNSFFDLLKNPLIENLDNLFSPMFSKVFKKPFYEEIFRKRNGIACDMETLDKIGQEHQLTRERVRQIEYKIVMELEEELKRNPLLSFSINYFLERVSNGQSFFEPNALYSCTKNVQKADTIRWMVTLGYSNYKFDEKLHLFYLKGCLEEIKQELLSPFGDYISRREYLAQSEATKAIISENYRFYQGFIWIKKSVNFSIVITQIVDETFPYGFHYSTEQYSLFAKAFEDKLGVPIRLTPQAIIRVFERENYCFIDRGTYKNRKYCQTIPEDLMNEIISYLSDHEGIVYYSSVFDAFKSDLLNLGITNRYYLKGLIDGNLPKGIIHKRDYISCGKTFKTSYQSINELIESSTGVIQFQKIRDAFPGVQDYVFFSCLSKRNDIIWLLGKETLILGKNITLSTELIDAISFEIETLFSILNTKVISCSKLYARMIIMHPNLMQTIPMIDSKFAFYSLTYYLYKDKYYFHRPYLSKDSSFQATYNSIIDNYIESLDRFSVPKLNDFVAKMGLKGIGNYLGIFIEKADEFVQINVNTAIKKDHFVIPNDLLTKLKEKISYFIDSFTAIDTRHFYGYESFPNVGISWNKHLLAGIIRSYFDEDYNIEYTSEAYDYTDYVITRNK
jgi:hypothetical protein